MYKRQGLNLGAPVWAAFEAELDHEDAVALTATWLEQALAGLRVEAVPGLADALRSGGLPSWGDLIDALPVTPTDDNVGLGRGLLLRAGLRFAVTSTRADLLDVVDGVLGAIEPVEHSAGEMLGAMLATDLGAVERLEAALDHLARNAETAPEALSRHARPGALAPMAPTTQLLWSTFHRGGFPRHGWAYEALQAVPEAFGRRLHALPVGMAHAVVAFSSRLTMERLVAIIAAAPSAFSSEGEPIASGALYALLEKVHEVFNSAEPTGQELDGQTIVEAVASRADAAWIGRMWLQRIQWELSRRGGQESRAWPRRLIGALSSRLAPLEEAQSRAWIQAEHLDSWRGGRVLVEASIALHHDDQKAAGVVVIWALRENVVTPTGREAALNTGSWESMIVQNALAMADLGVVFGALWQDGYLRRERARVTRVDRTDDGARITLAWGLCAVNQIIEGRASPWPQIADALREVRLQDPHFTMFGDLGSQILRYAAALCTSLVRRGELAIDDLSDLLDLVIEPTSDFVEWMSMMIEQDEDAARAAIRAVDAQRVRQALEMGLGRAGASSPQLAPAFVAKMTAFAQTL